MNTIKIEIFNDKSYIRFYQYENLREENEQLKKENKTLKDREEGFKKQIIGLCEKYHQIYERFPELKDAFLQGDRIVQENERAKVLLKATLDLLQKQKDSHYVLNLLETTSFYDEAECDGYCLFDDIENFLNFGS